MSTLSKLKEERIKKLKELRKQGINPYASFCCKKIDIAKALSLEGKEVEIVGRVLSLRGHGKLIFADIEDESGKIQLMLKYDSLGESKFKMLKLLDIGDFVFAKGKVGRSIRGEISLFVDDIKIISKSLRPLPEKWHGLKDEEERYRQRYLDLLINKDVKEVFYLRTKVIRLIREFLDKRGFVEVETPILQPIYGGATARPFKTYHNTLKRELYLRIADELYLKRLIVGGFEKVYEIGKDFRNEGMDKAHNPEFTQLEFYWAYVDYKRLMEFTEELFEYILKSTKGKLEVEYEEKVYSFKRPWKRISYHDLLLEHLKLDIDRVVTEKELLSFVREKKLLEKDEIEVGYSNILDKLYKKHIRPKLKGPLFLMDHPVNMKPLAKRKKDDPTKSASFQLVVAGEEFINAYNELNDPLDQKNRWVEEMKIGKRGAQEHQVVDEDYIRALEYGMPPTAGWGMGIDRLVAFLANKHTIKDVILFPSLRW